MNNRPINQLRILLISEVPSRFNDIKEVLKNSPEWYVFDKVSKASDAFRYLTDANYNLVVLDSALRENGAIKFLNQSTHFKNDQKVLVYHTGNVKWVYLPFIKLGALGVITNDSTNEELRRAIEEAIKGNYYVPDGSYKNLSLEFLRDSEANPFEELSEIEKIILKDYLQAIRLKTIEQIHPSDRLLLPVLEKLKEDLKVVNEIELALVIDLYNHLLSDQSSPLVN